MTNIDGNTRTFTGYQAFFTIYSFRFQSLHQGDKHVDVNSNRKPRKSFKTTMASKPFMLVISSDGQQKAQSYF